MRPQFRPPQWALSTSQESRATSARGLRGAHAEAACACKPTPASTGPSQHGSRLAGAGLRSGRCWVASAPTPVWRGVVWWWYATSAGNCIRGQPARQRALPHKLSMSCGKRGHITQGERGVATGQPRERRLPWLAVRTTPRFELRLYCLYARSSWGCACKGARRTRRAPPRLYPAVGFIGISRAFVS